MRYRVRWHATRAAWQLGTVGLLALAVALLTGHAAIMLLAAPVLAALAALSAAPRSRAGVGAVAGRNGDAAAVGPGDVAGGEALEVGARVSVARCFEREEITLTVEVAAGQVQTEIIAALELAPGFELVSGRAEQTSVLAERARARWTIRPVSWGRRPIGQVRVTCQLGAWARAADVRAGVVDVFPRAPAARATLVPPELLRRIGEHTGRAAGEGTEFASIRPYLPGDRLRDVNWRVTNRRDQLHVNQRAAPRAADLVVMVDAFSEVGPLGDSTLDAAVHGAAALATAYLRTGDRAGIVTLGGMLRWLGPAPGERQFYQIAEMVLRVRYDSAVAPDLDRIPRTALPAGALVVLFSPLLDERALDAVADLRQRGFPLVVVDVLKQEPPELSHARALGLALRLWRLDRDALRSSLTGAGVPVISWGGDENLDAALASVRRVPSGSGTGRR
ncbi:MAG TPA: DUF58 domain-containing protein [Streptosporangiaceae bacterium]